MQHEKKIAKKRGRPAIGTGRTVGVRIRPELSGLIEGWRAIQRPIPSQPEAIRRLVEIGLSKSAPGERLNAVRMLVSAGAGKAKGK